MSDNKNENEDNEESESDDNDEDSEDSEDSEEDESEVRKEYENDEDVESEDNEESKNEGNEEYENIGNFDKNKSLLRLRNTLIITPLALYILLTICQIVHLNQKLEEEKLNIANWTSESIPKEEIIDDVSNKALISTLLVSAIPILITFLIDLIFNYDKTITTLLTLQSFVFGCCFGLFLTLTFEVSSISYIRMHKTVSVCAQETCSQVNLKVFNWLCFALHHCVEEFQEYFLQEFFTIYRFDKKNSCPGIESLIQFSIFTSLIFRVFLYLPTLFSDLVDKYRPRMIEDKTTSYFKLSTLQDFLYSFMGGLAIGTNFLFENSIGTLTCLREVHHKINYLLGIYTDFREGCCSKIKISVLLLLTVVGAILGTYVSFLTDYTVIKWIKPFTVFYLLLPRHSVFLEFSPKRWYLKLCCIRGLAIVLGMIMVVLGAEYADPKKYYLTNTISQLIS